MEELTPSLEQLEAELGRSFQIGLLNLPRFVINDYFKIFLAHVF